MGNKLPRRESLRPFFRRITNFLIDKVTRMETSAVVMLEDLGLDTNRGSYYAPTSWFNLFCLRRVLASRPVSSEDVFIDFGSGKGRVLYVAAQYPFRKVIGVELTPELNRIARRNLARNRHRFLCKDIELITMDVLHLKIPDDLTVAFFYNPFKGHIFADVVDRICASLARHPRDFKLIYVNPTMHEELIRRGFRVVRKMRHLYVYRWLCPSVSEEDIHLRVKPANRIWESEA